MRGIETLCSSAGVIVQADDATWQELQDLPLVPRLWKNGFDVSIAFPSIVIVRSTPDGFRVSIALCWPFASGPHKSDRATANAQAGTERPLRPGRSDGLVCVSGTGCGSRPFPIQYRFGEAHGRSFFHKPRHSLRNKERDNHSGRMRSVNLAAVTVQALRIRR